MNNLYTKTFLDVLTNSSHLTVTEWAEKYAYISKLDGPEPGKYTVNRTPYIKRPQDCMTIGNGIHKVVLMFGAQLGKSQTVKNFVSYIVHHSPSPTMVVLPSIEEAKNYVKDRINSTFEETPVLKEMLKGIAKHKNSILNKEIGSTSLAFTGASSSKGLASKPKQNLILEEVDRMPLDVNGEGSPVELAIARTKNFFLRKIFMTSTPTDENWSVVYKHFLEGTQEYYFIPCPHCDGKQMLKWPNLRYKTYDEKKKVIIPESVYYECVFCHKEIYENSKQKMLEDGEWVAHNLNPIKGVVSFQLSSLYSPNGWMNWQDICQKWLDCQNSVEAKKSFYNTVLGEVYRDNNSSINADYLLKKQLKETFKQGQINHQIIALTAAVDVQENRLAFMLIGWGKNEEAWLIRYHEFLGDVANDEDVWKQMKNEVYKEHIHPSGIKIPVRYCAIDTGGSNTQKTYDFVSKHSEKFLAIKGSSHKQSTLMSKPHKMDIHYKSKVYKKGVDLYMLGTEIAKEELYSRYKKEWTEDNPGHYLHLPVDLDYSVLEMLTSEKKLLVYKNGYPVYEWKKKAEHPNEAFDTLVYNYCVAKAKMNLHLLDDTGYDKAYTEMFGNFGRVEELEVKQEPKKTTPNLNMYKKMGLLKNKF